MNNIINWTQIKQSLKGSFIEQDFQTYSNTVFNGVDFDKGLEIFRYILEQKLPNHDETTCVFEKLQLYSKGQQNKDILEKVISKYEPFIKKLFEIIGTPYTSNPSKPKAPALGWCYNKLFKKLSIPQNPQKDDFYKTTVTGKIEKPYYKSSHFKSEFLTDSTQFGKSLHSSYYLRNSNLHNDAPVETRQISEYITDCLNSYLYFVFKYYDDLIAVIPDEKLVTVPSLTIVNLASLSGGAYNPDIQNEIKRDNIIQTIEKKLIDLDVLFVEGEEGIGKSTILHQFVSKYPNNSFAYFIDVNDSDDYSILSILQSFCSQLHFEIKNEELENSFTKEFYDEDFLKKYFSSNFHQLTNNRSANKTFYFILDGLDKISQENQSEIKEHILDKIPYDKLNIKLIVTGKPNKNLLKSNCNYDKQEMIYLTNEDSHKVLGIEITQNQFEDINRIAQNNAGKIVFFRDLVNRIGIDTIIDKLSSDMKAIYLYLWNNYRNGNKNDEKSNLILAILAFNDKKYNVQSIAKLLGINESEAIDLIKPIPFIRKNIRGTYEYIFDGFANFAKTKLSAYKNKIEKIVIDYLLNDLKSVESLVGLPEIYKETGNKDGLMKLLTDERWKQLLVSSEKISVVSRVSNVALETIQDENENKYIPTLLKYSVLKSALNELSRTTVWQYEIAASLVLEDYIVAGNLANIAFLKEDRLKMFASIARAYTERKDKVPNEIQQKIQELYDDIDESKDFKNIKESAVEIASLLMYSNPKLAFRLIEDLSGTITDNDNAFDWALAQISLSINSNIEKLEDVSKEDINTKVYSKIRNPKIKEFADAILYLSENQDSNQIIEKINQLESTSQKMFLIRNWIGNNQKNEKVAEIIELGLKLVVDKSDKYVPKSSDYKIFSTPLPNIKDKSIAYQLIHKIEQYTASIEINSSTNDLLAIKLLITRAICNFDFEKGEERLLNIYVEIEDLKDLANRCTCLAIYANEAARIADNHVNQDISSYINEARNSIRNHIDEILEQTAMHFEIVQSIITNLSRVYPKNAIDICQKLNKSIDRDNAFLESLATYIKQSIEKVDTTILDELLDNITDLDIQKIAISEIIYRLEAINKPKQEYISKFYKYFERVDDLIDNRVKCLLYVKIISILELNNQDNSGFTSKLNQTWKELEKSVYKIELGFEIAYNAAFLKNKDFAKNMLRGAKEEKDEPEMLLDSPKTTEVFSLVIELSIRVFTGLVFRNNYEQEDINNIEKVISTLPSERRQMGLWASLILRIIPKSKDESFIKKLINSYIISKLSKIKNKNERVSAIMEVIVVLYFDDNNLPYLDELPNQKLKDIALSRICKYLFTKCLPDEICDDNYEGYTVNHETVEKILELTNLMGNDYFIASQIIELRNSIFSKKTIISNQKKIDIKDEFEKIANTKLPDKNNIKHSGYQLLVKANALAIQTKQRWQQWDDLLIEVEKIPNLSDKIFMWTSIVELLSNEFIKEKQVLINKSIESIYKLPSFLDTVGRVEMIIFTLYKKSIAGIGLKPIIENFMRIINSNPHSPFLRDNYKNILDVIHSIDPVIAKTLVNSFETDTARLNTGAYLNNHYNLLEFRSKFEKKINPNDNQKTLLENNPKFFKKIIDKKLGRLNATKSADDELIPKDLIYQLKMASKYSITECYNPYSYFIERMVLMYEDTEESKKLIRNSFSELLEVCNLIKLLSIRNADKIKSLLDVISTVETVEPLRNLNRIIDDSTTSTILNLLDKGKSAEEISLFMEIDLETVKDVQSTI